VTLVTTITVAGNNWTESLAVDHSTHRNGVVLKEHRTTKVTEVIKVIGNRLSGRFYPHQSRYGSGTAGPGGEPGRVSVVPRR
jgi:hypothetical protein